MANTRTDLDLPARFRDDDSEDNDGDINKTLEGQPQKYIQQSVYGIIAAAQGQSYLPPDLPIEGGSGSDSDDPLRGTAGVETGMGSGRRPMRHVSSRKDQPNQPLSSSFSRSPRKAHFPPEDRLIKSLLKPVPADSDSENDDDDHMTQSQFLVPATDPRPTGSDVADLSPPIASATNGHENDTVVSEESERAQTTDHLSLALAKIFQFEEPESVRSEHPCWYLQSVLLKGHLYITQNHVCFYAYLPKKGDVEKSGHLGKQGRSLRWRRLWCTLQGDILSYFVSAAEPFFPTGTIDLRFATEVSLSSERVQDDNMDVASFQIVANGKTHHFRADSAISAKDWVRRLQKIMFRAQNEGESVKIAFRIRDIVDIEPNTLLELANTVKIRVLDSEGTYAVDEYFFTFFKDGENGLNQLTALSGSDQRNVEHEAAPVRRKTLPSNERTFRNPEASSSGPMQESADSFAASSDRAPISSEYSDDQDVDMSASQILSGDVAFRDPTLRATPLLRHPRGTEGRGKPAERGHSISDASSADEGQRTVSRRTLAESSLGRGRVSAASPASQSQGILSHTTEISSEDRLSRPASTPLQHAYNLAGVVRSQSKRMSSYLSSSPKNYYERLSGAIAGGKRHYPHPGAPGQEDYIEDPELDMETVEHERRFQQHFGLQPSERLRAIFYCSLHRVLPLYGKIYISDRSFCFRSLIYGTRTKLVVPFSEIDNVTKEKGFRWRYPGMVLVIRRHEELFFDFGDTDARDDCVVTVLRTLDVMKGSVASEKRVKEIQVDSVNAAAENEALRDARQHHHKDDILDASGASYTGDLQPILFDDPNASLLDFKPGRPLRITCLTIGSRGDVQPYIALGKALMRDGHEVTIATHENFGEWVLGHGIKFAPVGGDPAELMRMCVENGMFTPSFMYEATSKFRPWLDGLLNSAWEACVGADLLIESPPAMAGIHIAEALEIPYFRAFTMPWTRTRAYPHAFAASGKRMGGQYNYTSYTILEYVFWISIAHQVNRWRVRALKLRPTDYTKLQTNKVPFLYNFSPSVVPPPLDFSDWIRITGYWFLDEGSDWQPPADLMDFIQKARKDKMKLVYVGFGSVPVSDTHGLTQLIVDAVVKADVRCILSKGWSDHFAQTDSDVPEMKLPSSIFVIRSAPHDWLFKQIDAAIHHGGAGTTGASLRVGLPTVIKPFFGDQHFFATRIEDLGVGIHLEKITVNSLGKAIWVATHDERMRTKARILGEKIRSEDGVNTAIKAIYRDLDYAKSLIKRRGATTTADGDNEEEEEESWTFIDNESDMDASSDYRADATMTSASQSVSQTAEEPVIRRYGLGSKISPIRKGVV